MIVSILTNIVSTLIKIMIHSDNVLLHLFFIILTLSREIEGHHSASSVVTAGAAPFG